MKARRWSSLAAFALAGGVSAFAATAAGLTVEGLVFTPATTFTVVCAVLSSVLIAIMTAVASANSDELLTSSIEQQRVLITDLRSKAREDEQLAIELREKVLVAVEDRSRTSSSLALLATALGALVLAPSDSREQQLGQLQMVLLRLLGETLEGPEGSILAPTRVVFLERTQERDVLLRKRWLSWGYEGDSVWDVAVSADEREVAKLIMMHSAPFKDGYLVDDVKGMKAKGAPLFLAPPEEGVSSYCRLGVRTGDDAWGILCIDTWKQGTTMTIADKAVGKAFADILGVALAVVRTDPKK